jgi:tRNA(Ser,Leu) C12 N-acetylase TAN1
MRDAPADAKADPADIAHRLLEKVKDEAEAKSLGVHLMRVLPVEDSCSLEVAQIEEMAKKLAAKYLPESATPVKFAVRPEPHSARLPGETNVGDLVRRVADCVPRVHTVDLTHPAVVILIILAGVSNALA